ncbi:hypothetical protein [Clostridium grantii]|uniref:TATA-box binding n=1 Tax=Clostridium grantii DSM 8605 TaxID=1121316 RepID=A0A1M5TIQ2_9CLOT|nr:hypothetical protein [Clostridium grantii]SHH50584.1 hypothetical protein SAMN02745207_01329 [Clostridium grantii DSM 8605]
MDGKKIAIICLTIIIIITNVKTSYALRNNDLIKDIIEESQAELLETGVDIIFESKNSNIKNSELIDIVSNIIESEDFNWFDEDEGIKFSFNNGEGYINKDIYKNNYRYHISLIKKGIEYNSYDIKEKFYNMTKQFEIKNLEVLIYAKAKLSEKTDLKIRNDEIINVLKGYGAEDFKTVEINNGFSTTTNTHRYSGKNINRRSFDLNFAVCKYSSGNYLIIGTPEITKSY